MKCKLIVPGLTIWFSLSSLYSQQNVIYRSAYKFANPRKPIKLIEYATRTENSEQT